ncbi:PREDICTED: probable G-protein coupled receptor No9 [Branchiostoma belcheri]|uniref:Probable G-protein coupled receptor No9 n=1 Tax=Branchiostoma belcheri TaxID=7741 RepID=A0A6P4YSJ0_BRABE|nr:PREDICTED: probable G-protein coupled receptor No9 [Branchiostoma belcheri]
MNGSDVPVSPPNGTVDQNLYTTWYSLLFSPSTMNGSGVPVSPPNGTADGNPYTISTAEKAVEISLLVIVLFFAFCGNLLVWVSVLWKRNLRRETANYLILSLSAADMTVAAFNLPFTVSAVALGGWVLGDGACAFLGFSNMITFVASVMNLAAIGVNRFCIIVHYTKYPDYFDQRGTAMTITGVWLLSILLAVPPLLGWAEYAYLPGQSICFCNWPSSVSYTFFMVAVCFGGPSSVMAFCYTRIITAVRESRRRVRQVDEAASSRAPPIRSAFVRPQVENSESTEDRFRSISSIKSQKHEEAKKRKAREDDIKLTKSFVVVILVFTICWLPFCVTMFWSVFSPTPVPRLVDMAALMLGYSNSCWNPIIYGVMNSKFRAAFKELLRKLFQCNWKR